MTMSLKADLGEDGDRVKLEPGLGLPERDEVGLPLGELRGESPIHCIKVWKGAPLEPFLLLSGSGPGKGTSSSWTLEERERHSRPPRAEESSPAGAEEERSRDGGMLSEGREYPLRVGCSRPEGWEKDRWQSGGLASDSHPNSSSPSMLGLRMT